MANHLIDSLMHAQRDLIVDVYRELEMVAKREVPNALELLAERQRFVEQSRAHRKKVLGRHHRGIQVQEEIILFRVEADLREEPQGVAQLNLDLKTVLGLEGARQVTGKITDEAGNPLPDVEVELFEEREEILVMTIRTNEEGELPLTNVSGGELRARVRVGGLVIEKKISDD